MSTNRSKDRSSLCSFMFVDGHPYLCVFHAVSCSGGSSDPSARRPRACLLVIPRAPVLSLANHASNMHRADCG
jgi:hypothetical protein